MLKTLISALALFVPIIVAIPPDGSLTTLVLTYFIIYYRSRAVVDPFVLGDIQ